MDDNTGQRIRQHRSVRQEEIIAAAARLYEEKNFKDITISQIGEATSFTRTSIYHYFQTKEEIFLALFAKEYDLWWDDLISLAQRQRKEQDFAAALAATLARRPRLLKLLSMNLYDMEEHSRIEKLVELKKAYGRSVQALEQCLRRHRPDLPEKERRGFLTVFFPFMYGLYPYTVLTKKQIEAMAQAGIEPQGYSIEALAREGICRLLPESKAVK